MTFRIRKNGDDLHSNHYYNKWNGEFNPFFPEFAPQSVGGDIKEKGNCTWYASGRYSEVFGEMPKRPFMRPNAYLWGTNGEKLSDKAEEGGVVVFGDDGYGHVAFIEKVENGVAYLSESSYSTKGNDFLFKYGRTIDQVCNEWGMRVLRYIAPLRKVTSVSDDLDFINESGTITVIEPQGMVMRSYPSRKDGKVVGGLSKGQSMKYNRKVANDGFMWVTDGKVYVASRKLDYSEVFVDVDGKPIVKPNGNKPKPQEQLYEGKFKVGQKIEFSTRYKSHHQDEIIEQGKMVGYIIHIYPKDKYQLAVSNTKGGKQNGATKPVNVFRIIG